MILVILMLITFSNRKLEKICNSDREMRKKCGAKRAKLLRRRLAQLVAAPSLETLNPNYGGPGRCHELTGNWSGHLSVDLDGPYRLLFVPGHNPVPKKEDGGLDWDQVTEIEVVGIEDTHG